MTTPMNALKKKYEAELDAAICNLRVYEDSPVGIGEHPDIVEAVESQVRRYADALEMIEAINSIEKRI